MNQIQQEVKKRALVRQPKYHLWDSSAYYHPKKVEIYELPSNYVPQRNKKEYKRRLINSCDTFMRIVVDCLNQTPGYMTCVAMSNYSALVKDSTGQEFRML